MNSSSVSRSNPVTTPSTVEIFVATRPISLPDTDTSVAVAPNTLESSTGYPSPSWVVGSSVYKDFGYLGILRGTIDHISEDRRQKVKKYHVKWENQVITHHTYEELLDLHKKYMDLVPEQPSTVAVAGTAVMSTPPSSAAKPAGTEFTALSPDLALMASADADDAVDDVYHRIIVDEEHRDEGQFSELLQEAEKFVIEQDKDDDDYVENAKDDDRKKAAAATSSVVEPINHPADDNTTGFVDSVAVALSNLADQHGSPPKETATKRSPKRKAPTKKTPSDTEPKRKAPRKEEEVGQVFPVGTIVRKDFQHLGVYYGIVIEYGEKRRSYLVQYEDDDVEEYSHAEVMDVVYYIDEMRTDERVLWEQHKSQQNKLQNTNAQGPKLVLFDYKVTDDDNDVLDIDDDNDGYDRKVAAKKTKAITSSSLKRRQKSSLSVMVISCSPFQPNVALVSLKALSSLWKNPRRIRKSMNEAIKDVKYPIGTAIRKQFGKRWFEGSVISYDPKTKYYKVQYTDGDKEEYYEHELVNILLLEADEDKSLISFETYDDNTDNDESYRTDDDYSKTKSKEVKASYLPDDEKPVRTRGRPKKEATNDTTKSPKFSINTRIEKVFPKLGRYEGTIVRYYKTNGCYHVKYDDGDSEDLEENEVEKCVVRQNKKKTEKINNSKGKKVGPNDKVYVRKYANGSTVNQYFDSDRRSYVGDVVHFNSQTGLYSVIYEHGIQEDYKEQELEYILRRPRYVPEHQGTSKVKNAAGKQRSSLSPNHLRNKERDTVPSTKRKSLPQPGITPSKTPMSSSSSPVTPKVRNMKSAKPMARPSMFSPVPSNAKTNANKVVKKRESLVKKKMDSTKKKSLSKQTPPRTKLRERK